MKLPAIFQGVSFLNRRPKKVSQKALEEIEAIVEEHKLGAIICLYAEDERSMSLMRITPAEIMNCIKDILLKISE